MKLGISISQIKFEFSEISDRVARPFLPNKLIWLFVLATLVVVSISAWGFYFQQGLTLSYNDARSHLNVARRVVDSLQPGAAQIGSVWLPLYHVLEIPFV